MGAVERSGKGIPRLIKASVDPDGSLLIADEFRACNAVSANMFPATVNHSKGGYVSGDTHTNSLWSLVERSWYGMRYFYRKHSPPFYVAEMFWKYNRRKNNNAFGAFMRGCFA